MLTAFFLCVKIYYLNYINKKVSLKLPPTSIKIYIWNEINAFNALPQNNKNLGTFTEHRLIVFFLSILKKQSFSFLLSKPEFITKTVPQDWAFFAIFYKSSYKKFI